MNSMEPSAFPIPLRNIKAQVKAQRKEGWTFKEKEMGVGKLQVKCLRRIGKAEKLAKEGILTPLTCFETASRAELPARLLKQWLRRKHTLTRVFLEAPSTFPHTAPPLQE